MTAVTAVLETFNNSSLISLLQDALGKVLAHLHELDISSLL